MNAFQANSGRDSYGRTTADGIEQAGLRRSQASMLQAEINIRQMHE